MTPSAQGVGDLLSGMVSPAAAALFDRLLQEGPVKVDCCAAEVQELIDVGLMTVRGRGDDRTAAPLPLHQVLARLLDHRHRHMGQLQEQLAATWLRFSTLAAAPVEGEEGWTDGVTLITDYGELARLASGLYRSPKRLLRATLNGEYVGGLAPHGPLLPPPDAIEAGVEFRMIYDIAHVTDEWGAHSAQLSVEAGEQAKVRARVPIKMMHVDDTVALVTTDRTGSAGGLQVRSPALLELLAEWFDLLWTDSSTAVWSTAFEPAEEPLGAAHRRVLQLMAAGLTDEAIAVRTNASVRTVRRQVSAILETLRAESRFAAGVAAAKRGWL